MSPAFIFREKAELDASSAMQSYMAEEELSCSVAGDDTQVSVVIAGTQKGGRLRGLGFRSELYRFRRPALS